MFRLKRSHTLSRRRYTAYVVILILSVVFLYFLLIRDMRFFLVPTSSMVPALRPRDYIMTMHDDRYERGDIVVTYDPLDPTQTTYVVKRIVGLPGDTIRIIGGALFLNGSYASEPYLNEHMKYDFPAGPTPFSVPDGTVFVLGDNRNFSEDSSSEEWRQRGMYDSPAIPLDKILGRVRFIYLPIDRARAVRSYPLTNLSGE